MNQFTITNAIIVPLTEKKEVVQTGYVRVKDGIISDVGREPAPDGETGPVLDANQQILLPGLINAHTHLYQVLLRAVWEDLSLLPWLKRIYGVAEVLEPDHLYAGSLLGCLEAIKGGVTTVCEHNFLNPHPECAGETVRAIRDSGLRGVFARTIMNTGEIVPLCVREKPEEAFQLIERLLADHFNTTADGEKERISFMVGPNTPPINTTGELLKEIRSFADRHSIGISAHVAESQSVVDFVREQHGRPGVVAYLQDYGIPGEKSIFAHCVHLSNEEIQILRKTGTSVSHNPVSNMMLGDGVAPVIEMLREGVNVALGTDGAASNHSQDLFETMKVASLLQKVHHRDAGVIDPYTVLRMATIGGARALGLDRICGTIELGKRADLILVESRVPHNQPINNLFSQLVHCAKSSDVQTVVVNGRILMRNREVTELDEGRIISEAQRAGRDLMQRLAEG
ncbi:MAG: amidohydrolase [Deltaproteobacteria bacterium]|nr:amidohydrolase [Deltaproteobacteria bacterium]